MKCKILLFRFKSVKWFEYDSGDKISLYCTDIDETYRLTKNVREGLSVSIFSSEISS